ncbi:SRPBCC family protein [Kribbella deserti]|uniref:SRPBCC family protein n=1 Tax=Kribbella deserti TaxID=1926257 RepID=A0ABV6QY82_9ACTN
MANSPEPKPPCHAEVSVEVEAGAHEVWNAVVNWDIQSTWMLFTKVWPTENNGEGIGGKIAARTGIGPVGFIDDMVITHWEPPLRCRVEHLGKIVRGTGDFIVAPMAAGTRFTWAEDVIPPFGRFGVAAWPAVRPVFELMMRISVARLAARVTPK